jgi:hypothetical protein
VDDSPLCCFGNTLAHLMPSSGCHPHHHPAPVMQANGTPCSRPAFILLAGTVQILFFRSISDHRALKTSPDRAAVRMQNSRASTVVA